MFPRQEKSSPSTLRHNTAKDGSTLCRQCGICCVGGLFSTVKVNTQEAKALKHFKVSTEVYKDGKSYFKQPCNAFLHSSCSAYGFHPGTCSNYQCKLLKSVYVGEIELDDAIKIVNISKQQITYLIKFFHKLYFKQQDMNEEWPPTNVNLRELMEKIYEIITTHISNSTFSKNEENACLLAFDYYKDMKKYFHSSSMFSKFLKLLNSIDSINNSIVDKTDTR